jgi:hypothetical protein
MRGEHHRRAGIRDLVELLDEHRALLPQAVDDVFVVDDGVADLDRGAVTLQRQLDDLDCPVDARAESARGAQRNVQVRPCLHTRRDAARRRPSQVLRRKCLPGNMFIL